MQGIEIDFVVKDSLEAITLYEKIFPLQRLEVTDFKTGANEVVFTIFESRFHMLDENPEYMLFAPKEGATQSFWFNVVVDDIEETYNKAIDNGCKTIQALTQMEEYGISTAMFLDPFGYVWHLHEIHKEVSFEDRMDLMRDEFE